MSLSKVYLVLAITICAVAARDLHLSKRDEIVTASGGLFKRCMKTGGKALKGGMGGCGPSPSIGSGISQQLGHSMGGGSMSGIKSSMSSIPSSSSLGSGSGHICESLGSSSLSGIRSSHPMIPSSSSLGSGSGHICESLSGGPMSGIKSSMSSGSSALSGIKSSLSSGGQYESDISSYGSGLSNSGSYGQSGKGTYGSVYESDTEIDISSSGQRSGSSGSYKSSSLSSPLSSAQSYVSGSGIKQLYSESKQYGSGQGSCECSC